MGDQREPATGAAMPPGIVPRWEWRTFGDRFGEAEDVLRSFEPSSVSESDEVYVLSATSDASVKVRDGLMDVKQFLEVNDAGLELWRPVLKAEFPLSAEAVESVLAALDVDAPASPVTPATPDEFERDVVAPHPGLRAVHVHKRRTRYVVDGCMVEMTLITADGASTNTLAVESIDPSTVSATIARFGLGGVSNVCVPRGLKALVGFGSRRYAVIDVGTNSVKFHLGERRPDGSLATIVDRADTTRLGEGQSDSGVLADAAIARTADAVAADVEEARREGVSVLVAVGTAGLRRAPNRHVLVDAVRERADLEVEVISGEEEARLAYLAATSALPPSTGSRVVFDSGGGSTQFTFGQGEHVEERFSLDVGAVRISERFGLAGPIDVDTLEEVLAAVAAELDRLAARPRPDAIVAIGGTSTNLAAVKHGLEHYDPEVVQGTVLDVAEIDRQIHLYRTRSADERRQIVGLQSARADVILGGACIVRTILTVLGHDRLTVSDHGLRHGLVLEHFAR
jgi:exopolyphosphatase/guanosine-5'-triphosphate,3'-diphosphate pyrophosphatase